MRGPGLLPVLVAAAAVLLGGSLAASSHSLRYFYTGVSEPGQGLPRFITVGYVDDQLFVQYDSDTKKALPRVPWMEKVDVDNPQYWEQETQNLRNSEQVFRVDLGTLRGYYNQSGGLHTWQWMVGCELRSDGSKGGYDQDAYDGRDYICFDKETLTWTAADSGAQNTKRKWEKDPAIAQGRKAYLEETCVEWLRRYLAYRNETLQQRREPPKVKLTRHKASTEDMETLVCQAHGFYPKEIDATWTRDGQSWEHETFRRRVVPNADGTYYIWICIDIDPKERDLYRCRVDHATLSQPLVLAWEEPAGNVGIIVGAVIGAVVLLVVVTIVIVTFTFTKKRRASEVHKPQISPGGSSEGSEKTLLETA